MHATAEATDELCFLPALELLRLLRAKELSARELMRACLDQIARLNSTVNALVTLLPGERLLARRRGRRRGLDEGPMAWAPPRLAAEP